MRAPLPFCHMLHPTSLPCPLARRSPGPQKRTSSTASHTGKGQRTDFHSTALSVSSDNLKQTRLPFALSSRRPPPPPDSSAPAPPRSVLPDIRQFFRPATPTHQPPPPRISQGSSQQPTVPLFPPLLRLIPSEGSSAPPPSSTYRESNPGSSSLYNL